MEQLHTNWMGPAVRVCLDRPGRLFHVSVDHNHSPLVWNCNIYIYTVYKCNSCHQNDTDTLKRMHCSPLMSTPKQRIWSPEHHSEPAPDQNSGNTPNLWNSASNNFNMVYTVANFTQKQYINLTIRDLQLQLLTRLCKLRVPVTRTTIGSK